MERLKRRRDFLAAAAGAKASTAGFVLQERPRGDGGPARVGFTVSKKVGGAVERNRVRRRLREIVRLGGKTALCTGHDYVLVGRRSALAAPFAEMMRDLDTALHRVHATGAARAQPLHEAQSPRPKPQQRPQRKPRKA